MLVVYRRAAICIVVLLHLRGHALLLDKLETFFIKMEQVICLWILQQMIIGLSTLKEECVCTIVNESRKQNKMSWAIYKFYNLPPDLSLSIISRKWSGFSSMSFLFLCWVAFTISMLSGSSAGIVLPPYRLRIGYMRQFPCWFSCRERWTWIRCLEWISKGSSLCAISST